MFIRYVTDRRDEDTNAPAGVFTAAYRLLEDPGAPDYLRDEIRTTLDWFKRNLPIPARFARSRRPHRDDKGVCWFKTEASDCMHHIRYLAYLVAEQGVVVRELSTDNPGYRIYEDDSQVVAEPFSSTPR
jgi:hypothetical protein